jgi:hypothetical protein
VFPAACVAIYFFSASGASATPLHAFQGITVPLGVLAVLGLARAGWYERRGRPRIALGVAVLALATIPATVWELKSADDYMRPVAGNANFIQRDERDALNYIRHAKGAGGVLARTYLGLAVPARTGRPTFVGDCLWSQPHCVTRLVQTRQLFAGDFDPDQARTFVLNSGARFVLADCRDADFDLTRVLAPILVSARQFGCARVFEIASPGRATGPLAQSPAHVASVRTPGRQQRRVQPS